MPRLARNVAFTLMPIGFTMIFAVLVGLSVSVSSLRSLSLATFFAIPVSFLVAVAIAVRPPAFVKPSWLVDEETAHGAPTMPLQGFDVLLASILVLAGIITAASFAFLLLRA